MLPRLASAALALPLAFLLGAATVPPEESDFLERFAGPWNGTGLVQRNPDADPQKVNCSLDGARTANRITIAGTCRAYLVFSRKVSAEILFDPETDRYVGTYIGSKVGPASLTGRRNGDAVDLTVLWPRPVHGDREARMRIQNGGDGSLRILVTDDYGKGEETVTDVSLVRSG